MKSLSEIRDDVMTRSDTDTRQAVAELVEYVARLESHLRVIVREVALDGYDRNCEVYTTSRDFDAVAESLGVEYPG